MKALSPSHEYKVSYLWPVCGRSGAKRCTYLKNQCCSITGCCAAVWAPLQKQTPDQLKCPKTCCFDTISHLQSGRQLSVPPLVTQHCSMWWLASRPPTLLPASPAVFSITMRSCGVVNLPTMTLLSPCPSALCLSLSAFPHSLFIFVSSLTNAHAARSQTICNFWPAVTLTL